MEFLKKNVNALVDSFKKIDLRLVYSILYDFLCYGLIIICLRIYQFFLVKLMVKMPDPTILQSMTSTSAELTQILSTLKGVFLNLFLYTLLLVIAIFLIWCLFKALIWNTVSNKKFTWKFYKKFLILNLLWGLMWFIPLVLFFLLVKQNILPYIVIVIFLLLIYFTYILYIQSVKENKIKKIIKSTFSIGLKRVYYFIIPLIVMILVFLIVMQLYWLLKGLSQVVQAVIFVIVFIIFIAWTRFYISNVVDNL